MKDFFGNTYELGDIIYYVTTLWDRHLQARIGKIVAIHATTITVKGIGGLLSVLRQTQRHVNITKIQNKDFNY